MKRKISFFLLFSVLSFFPSASLMGEGRLYCRECGNGIRGNYYKLKEKTYCSESCVRRVQQKLLPKCTRCGKPSGRLWTNLNSRDKLCDDCKDLPLCFFCFKPAGNRQLADGRKLCSVCAGSAVGNYAEAMKKFNGIRRELKAVLGLETGHRIHFDLATYPQLLQVLERSPHGGENGLFRHEQTIRTMTKTDARTGEVIFRSNQLVRQKYSIYILTGLPEEEFRHTAAHELTHDWMSQFCPNVADLKIKEGVSEYVSWLFLKKNGNAARTCERIEKNPDPVYGEGFRMIRSIAGNGSSRQCLERLKKYLLTKNRKNPGSVKN